MRYIKKFEEFDNGNGDSSDMNYISNISDSVEFYNINKSKLENIYKTYKDEKDLMNKLKSSNISDNNGKISNNFLLMLSSMLSKKRKIDDINKKIEDINTEMKNSIDNNSNLDEPIDNKDYIDNMKDKLMSYKTELSTINKEIGESERELQEKINDTKKELQEKISKIDKN